MDFIEKTLKHFETIEKSLISEVKKKFEIKDLLNNNIGYFAKGLIDGQGRIVIHNQIITKRQKYFLITFETLYFKHEILVSHSEFFQKEPIK